MILNLADRRTLGGRYTTLAARINIDARSPPVSMKSLRPASRNLSIT
ncbi:MAG: hypothetical protein JSS35_09940 [Proteobacteria bacterium]|nr:hypothetical protein [Pseudomonadota bacterium]